MKDVDTRERLLGAANRIVSRSGPGRLTIDAVALEARVSKGGVLYHFPSKAALLTGMVDQLIEAFEADIERFERLEPPGRGRWLRAYVRSSLRPPDGELEAAAAVLAAAFTDPSLLDGYRQRARAWRAKATADGTDAVVAAAIMYAADGVFLDDLFRVDSPEPEVRSRMVKVLCSWIESGPEATSASRSQP